MSRYVKNSDGETDVKAGYRTRGIVSTETVDSPLRRSSRVKSAGKQNESSPESPSSDSSNISNTQSVRNTRRRTDTLNNSTMTERSRSLRLRRSSVVSDAIETADTHAAISTPTKKTRNISTNDGVNKLNDQTSFSRRLTRAGSESKSPQIITRPTRRTRASSVGPEGVIENNVLEVHNSGIVHNTPVNTRKRKSMAPLEATVIEESEEKIPFVTLDRVLPNFKEMKETYSENSTTETLNKSISNSKETLNSSSGNTCKEEMEADGNAKKGHATPIEHPSAETVQENETGMSSNKNTLSDISEKSRSESTHTITQMKTSIPDVPKTQSPISTEVTQRKLRLKNESSIKEEDEHLSNKENRASNIIEDPKSNDLTISNILSQSPQPLVVSDACTEKPIKENDEDTDSSDNAQHLVVTDTESLSGTPFNDITGRSASCIEVCEDSSLDENIQIMKCPENVNNIDSLNSLNDDEDQKALSVEMQDDSNQDGGSPIQKCEENISDTHTDKSFKFDNEKKEQIQHSTSEDETTTKDENIEMRLILEAEETANIDKEDPKEVYLTQIATADAECEESNQAGVCNTSGNLNDTGVVEYSKLSDMSVDKIPTSSITSTGDTTTNDSQETEMATDETTPNNLKETEMATDETTTNDLQETETSTDETTTNDLQETGVAADETTTNDLQETEMATDETTPIDLQETEMATDETTPIDLKETAMATDETIPNDLQETEMATDETTTNDLQETEMATDETTTNDLQETEVAAKVPSRKSITKEPFNVYTQSNNVELANENENNISNVIENNVAQSLVEPIDKASEEVDITQNTSKVDNCLASEKKSITDSNSQNDIEKNEIAETVQKQEEKMPVDDTDLFQDIPADEWTERNSDKNSVHSMSTERLENESENECDDFVLVDKEISPTAENIEQEKESSDYDSDDTVLLKAQKNSLQEKTVERMDMSESQCETNENKSTMVKDTQQSMRQEKIIAAEANSENQEGHVANQTEEVQNAENVSTRTSITNEVSKQSPLESDTSLEKPADTNLTTEIDQTLDTESPLNKRESKSRLSKDGSNERKSVCKSVEKSDSEVEEPSEVDAVDEKDSLSKSPIGSPSNVSDSSKTDESMDSDIEREYNLNGVEVCKFSDDDVPGDECRASETESSDPDDNGSDLADFVVNDDDEISEEVESRELHEGSSNGYDDKHLESDRDAIDEERGKIQMQDEKRRKNGKQNRIDRGTSEKEKSKSKKSEKLGLDKITGSDKKITNSENRTIDKRRKRNKVKRCVEEEEISEKELAEQSRKVQIYKEEIAKKVTTKVQRRRGAEEYVERIEDKYTDTPKKEQSKLRKTTKLDLSEMSESGKNVKRKCEIETGNRIRKIKADDNGSRMQKENAIPTWKKYETPTVKSNKMEVSRKRGRNLLEDSPSGFTIDILKKRKLNLEGSSSLSLYGSTTNFYVQDIEKLKKRKNTSETQLYRQRMLNRRARHLNNLMFLETIRFVYTANLVRNHLKLF